MPKDIKFDMKQMNNPVKFHEDSEDGYFIIAARIEPPDTINDPWAMVHVQEEDEDGSRGYVWEVTVSHSRSYPGPPIHPPPGLHRTFIVDAKPAVTLKPTGMEKFGIGSRGKLELKDDLVQEREPRLPFPSAAKPLVESIIKAYLNYQSDFRDMKTEWYDSIVEYNK